MNTLVYADVEDRQASQAGSIASTAQQMSLSFGVAFGALLTAWYLGGVDQTDAQQTIPALHKAFVTMGWLTAVSALVLDAHVVPVARAQALKDQRGDRRQPPHCHERLVERRNGLLRIRLVTRPDTTPSATPQTHPKAQRHLLRGARDAPRLARLPVLHVGVDQRVHARELQRGQESERKAQQQNPFDRRRPRPRTQTARSSVRAARYSPPARAMPNRVSSHRPATFIPIAATACGIMKSPPSTPESRAQVGRAAAAETASRRVPAASQSLNHRDAKRRSLSNPSSSIGFSMRAPALT